MCDGGDLLNVRGSCEVMSDEIIDLERKYYLCLKYVTGCIYRTEINL